MRGSRLSITLGLIVCSLLFAQSANAQATRTWVSGVGDDANPCSRTAPCKTFAGAISKTAASGEIDCIDPGGFGAVTITKSITIDCTGTFGSILASGTNGIIVNAASVNVTVRGLSINGAATGLNGIRFLQSGTLRVEGVNIFGFTQKGIDFEPNGNSEMLVTRSGIYDNGTGGINIAPTANASAITTITGSTVQNNSLGIAANSTASSSLAVAIRETTVAGNTNEGVSATSGTTIVMTIDKSSMNSNGTGISSNGANTTVQLANSIVVQNQTGLGFSGSGKLISFSSNVINGNFVTAGTPTSTVPPQ